MKEIFINVDFYNSEGIKTIQGNNNAEIYKIYVSENKRRLNLANKTIKLGYVMAGTTKGDIIENLNITNAEQGEITFPITNRISKQDGVYSCQLAIYGADGFLEHTATFGLTVEANIFTKIAGEIADSKDFTYLENILDKASKLSEKLKENTSSATNANSNLESNITEANNINSKLLENTSTATSLNKNLESNIDLAKEVKETIKDLDTKNIEATEKIETLTDLNNKAQELSNNINQALPLNSELVRNTESAKVTNTNLAATNQEAASKNTELQASLEKTKEFIEGLDGSQNIPQLRLDVTELQNGLKSNQSLAYQGSSISADNTLEGRTEGMRIGGRTLVNLKGNVKNRVSTWVDNDDKYTLNLESGHGQPSILYNLTQTLKENQKYTVIVNLVEYTSGVLHFSFMNSDGNKLASTTELVAESKGLKKFVFTINNTVKAETLRLLPRNGINNIYSISKNILILEGDWTNKEIPSYFEGLKSFGEAEKVEDKYKISILSSGANLITPSKCVDGFIYQSDIDKNKKTSPCFELNLVKGTTYFFTEEVYGCYLDNSRKFIENVGFVGNKLVSKYTGIAVFRPHMPYSQENSNYKNLQEFINKFMVNEGQNLLPYEPYKCNKKDILIKEPLRKSDYLYEDNGQVKVNRYTRQYTFTGNENYSKKDIETEKDTLLFWTKISAKANSLCLSDKFVYDKNLWNGNSEGIAIDDKGNILVRIKSNNLSSPDGIGFKEWLKANPTTIVYQLATPVVEVVDGVIDIDLDTYQEKTYFNILNSLPGTLDFKVPSNIGSVVQNMAKEVNNIWDVINNLLVPSILDVNKKVALATIKNNLK